MIALLSRAFEVTFNAYRSTKSGGTFEGVFSLADSPGKVTQKSAEYVR